MATPDPSCGIPRFRFHDLRHQAITEMAEAGASDATIMAVVGHVDRAMMEHYSHVRMAAKRDVYSDGRRTQPQSTSQNHLLGRFEVRKVLRELVGASGFEPPTSWSRTRRSSQAEPRPEE